MVRVERVAATEVAAVSVEAAARAIAASRVAPAVCAVARELLAALAARAERAR